MDAHLVRPCGRVVSFTRHPGGSRDPGVPRRPAQCEVGPSLSRGQALGPRFRGDDVNFVARCGARTTTWSQGWRRDPWLGGPPERGIQMTIRLPRLLAET